MQQRLSTVIAKPTKDCNADCEYCSSPPDLTGHWTFEKFKKAFDILFPQMHEQAIWIWHGGEPMMLGHKFYKKCWEYVKEQNEKHNKAVKFSIQTNILLYNKQWKSVFRDVFNSSISTSFDPDMSFRTLNGDVQEYKRQFEKKLDMVLEDGFCPMVVSTYDESSIQYAYEFYEKSKNSEKPFHIRFNYRYPAGRANNNGKGLIDPESYGDLLVNLYNRWINDAPAFSITPLDQMLDLTVGGKNDRCPWTRTCNQSFIGIEPNGDLYNCPDFADLNDESFKFGNIFNNTVNSTPSMVIKVQDANFYKGIHKTKASKAHYRRRVVIPVDCNTCEHYRECQGGCMRDAELYNRGLGGKFFYCQSWKMVFKRIKESVMSGEADSLLKKQGYDPDEARRFIKENKSVF